MFVYFCFVNIRSNSSCTLIVIFQKHLTALNLQARGQDLVIMDMEEAVKGFQLQPQLDKTHHLFSGLLKVLYFY